MQKNLIALAAIALSGAACAQSSVTLFGVVDVNYESVKTNSGRISGMAQGGNLGSRIGFRGVEDLGGGMSAGFWLEGHIAPDSGSTPSGTSVNNQTAVPAGGLMFGRRSTVSLFGGFGELRLGRDYTPTYWSYGLYDPFRNLSVGASITAWPAAFMAASYIRTSNTVGYLTPNIGGFNGWLAYAMGERASNETQARPAVYGTSPVNIEDNGRYIGARLGYAKGPLDVAAAYGRTTYAAGTNTASPFGLGAVSTGDFTDMNLGGSYNFGVVKAMALLVRNKLDDAGAPGNALKVTGWNIGGNWPVGSGDILTSYGRVKMTSGLLATQPEASKWSVGYVHNFSKRTAAYFHYARVSNSGGGAMTAASLSPASLGAVAGPSNVNGTSTGVNIGLRHTF